MLLYFYKFFLAYKSSKFLIYTLLFYLLNFKYFCIKNKLISYNLVFSVKSLSLKSLKRDSLKLLIFFKKLNLYKNTAHFSRQHLSRIKNKITVIRSPFVFKKKREQFESREYKIKYFFKSSHSIFMYLIGYTVNILKKIILVKYSSMQIKSNIIE